MGEILSFTRWALVRVFDPADEKRFYDAEIDVPSPNFGEDNADRSTVWGDEESFDDIIDGEQVSIVVSAYNSIVGGGVQATWNGEEATTEILETQDENEDL